MHDPRLLKPGFANAACLIDEAAGEDYSPLLINGQEAAIAQTVIVAVLHLAL